MAINIPRLQQTELAAPQDFVPVSGTSGQAAAQLDVVRAKVVQGIGKKVEAGFDIYDQAAKTKAKELALKYDTTMDTQITQFNALPLGGDLSQQYVDLKKFQDKVTQEALKLAENDTVKNYLKIGLLERDSVLNRQIESKYAQANVAYQAQTNKQQVGTLVKDVMSLSPFFNPKDDAVVTEMDDKLNRIGETYQDTAQAMGLAPRDASGQPVYDPNTMNDIAKAKAQAVTLAVKSLFASGKNQQGADMLTRYSDLIPPEERASIMKSARAAQKTEQVNKSLNALKDLPEPEAQTAINNIPDDEVRETVSVKYNSEQGRKAAAKNRIKKNAEDQIYTFIDTAAGNGDPVESMDELKNSQPDLYDLVKNDAEAMKRINNHIGQRPYSTDFDQMNAVMDAIADGSAFNWTSDQLKTNTDKLNQKDYQRVWVKLTGLKTGKGAVGNIKSATANDISAKVKTTITGTYLLPSKPTGGLTPTSARNWALTYDYDVDAEIAKLKPDDVKTPEQIKKAVNDIANKMYSKYPKKKEEGSGFSRFLNNLF